jgi:YesN/AraC family two-component response regulator
MPGMDGMECAQRILQVDPEARIVMFSGYEPGQRRLPDLLGQKLVKGYLTKPADIVELSRFLSKVIQEKKQA